MRAIQIISALLLICIVGGCAVACSPVVIKRHGNVGADDPVLWEAEIRPREVLLAVGDSDVLLLYWFDGMFGEIMAFHLGGELLGRARVTGRAFAGGFITEDSGVQVLYQDRGGRVLSFTLRDRGHRLEPHHFPEPYPWGEMILLAPGRRHVEVQFEAETFEVVLEPLNGGWHLEVKGGPAGPATSHTR